MINALAFGSDVARSRKQHWTRKLAAPLARFLNGTGALATEIVQAINPVARIDTRHGPFYCRAGHGRLVWRAETFHTEEPDTVAWLDTLRTSDVLWDVGANVGLYSIYAAKFMGCRVYAFEPEGQNYALLMENISLNGVGVQAANVALTDRCGFGRMHVRYITKGGAFNTFGEHVPESAKLAARDDGVTQFTYGVTGDELVLCGFDFPTHLKIDVDGIEPRIIAGCEAMLRSRRLRSVLVELNMDSALDREVPHILEAHGFRLAEYGVGKRSTKRPTSMVNVVYER